VLPEGQLREFLDRLVPQGADAARPKRRPRSPKAGAKTRTTR
jgi:hypothetical protein